MKTKEVYKNIKKRLLEYSSVRIRKKLLQANEINQKNTFTITNQQVWERKHEHYAVTELWVNKWIFNMDIL